MNMALQEVTEEPIGKSICSEHGDIQDMFCMDCEEQICLICGQQNHKSHDWNRKTTFLERVRSVIEEECSLVRQQKIPLLKAEIEKIKNLRDENDKHFLEKLETISLNAEHVVTILKRLSRDLMGHCKSLHEQFEERLNTQQNEGESRIAQFECCLKDVDEKRKHVDLIALLQLKKEMKSIPYPAESSEMIRTYIKRLDHIEYVEGSIDETLLHSFLGTIYQSYSNVTVSKTYEAKKGTNMIKYISPTSGHQAWFREFRSLENVLIDIKTDTTETENAEKTYSGPIPDDFITLPNGVNVYTWHTGHYVMKESSVMTRDSVMTTKREVKLADLSPLFPAGICATVEGRFLVSAIDTTAENELLFTCNLPKKSVVILLSKRGKTKKVFQYENDGKTPLFLFPYRLSENTNGDICVIDRTGMMHGQMVVLSSCGKLKFNYRGTGSEKDDFDPRAICCDAVGHILLSDFGNKCVHLIDHDGTLLTYLIRTNEETCSMSLYLNQLWIGGKNGTISVYHYQVSTK